MSSDPHRPWNQEQAHIVVVQQSPERSPTWKRVLRWVFFGGLFTAIGSTLVMVATWDDADGLQRRICVDWSWSSDRAQAREGLCQAKYTEISLDEAARAYDDFLYQASIGTPDDALDMLGPSQQDADRRQDFIARWDSAALAERVDEVIRHEDFNTFDTVVRVYRVTRPDGWQDRIHTVDEYTLPVRLELTDEGDIVFTRFFSKVNRGGREYRMPRIRFITDTAARINPSHDSGLTAFTDVRRGSVLRGLCQMRVGDSWWMQTYGGWFLESEFIITESPDERDIFTCSDVASTVDEHLSGR